MIVPRTIANNFNSSFYSVAEELQPEVAFSYKTFCEYLRPPKTRFSSYFVQNKK